MNPVENLLTRIKRLPLTPDELGMTLELALLEDSIQRGRPDTYLYSLLNEKITEAEHGLRANPFLEPPRDAGLDAGDVRVLTTPGGQCLGFSFGPGRENPVGHAALLGPTGAGKTVLLCLVLAAAARSGLRVLLVSTNPSVLGLDALRGFVVVLGADAQFNPYHAPRGVDVRVWDQHVTSTLSRLLELQWGELEIGEIVAALRARGVVPTIPRILAGLEARQRGSWSRRHQYRDSAILTLRGLHHATAGAFSNEGVDPRLLFNGRVILLLPFAPRYAGLVQQVLLVVAWLLGTVGGGLGGHVVFGVDEAQALGTDRDAPGLLLGLRHAGVSWVGCWQNAQALPPLVLGNMDLLVSFRATDTRDRTVVAGALSLTRDQADALGVLGPREVVVFSPRWPWKRASKALVPAVSVHRVTDADVQARSAPWRDAAARAADDNERRGDAAWGAGAGGEAEHPEPVDGRAGSARGEASGRTGPNAGRRAARAEAAGAGAEGVSRPGADDRKRGEGSGAGGSEGAGVGLDRRVLDGGLFRFMVNVTTESHEYNALTMRMEAAGIRSAELQQRVLKRAVTEGLVTVCELAVGRGRPIKLVEATETGFAWTNAKPWAKTRGTLATRAASHLVHEKLRKLAGWTVVREGFVAGKQVDLVCRDTEGRLVTVEIAGAAGAAHEAHNALHCLAQPEVWKHVVVGVSLNVVDGVRKKFAGFEKLRAGERLAVEPLTRVLREDWKP
jgi:hypothetical protein